MDQGSVRHILLTGLRSRYCREVGCREEVSGPALHAGVEVHLAVAVTIDLTWG